MNFFDLQTISSPSLRKAFDGINRYMDETGKTLDDVIMDLQSAKIEINQNKNSSDEAIADLNQRMYDNVEIIKDDTIGNESTWSSNKIKQSIPVIPTIQMAEPIYSVGFESYSDDQKPMFYFLRFDNFYLVHFVGVIRKTALLMTRNYPFTNPIPVANTPNYLKPLTKIQVLSQGSQDKKYLLVINTDGSIDACRYGDMFDDNGVQSQKITDNSILVVNAFYIASV